MSDIEVLHFLYNRGYSDMSSLKQLLLKYKCEGTDPTPIYHFICHTRSIANGKGERDLSYRMIITLFSVFPSVGLDALRYVILVAGGLNDVKRFCIFVENIDCEPLVSLAVSLANSVLRENGYGKWIPRERGHKELYDRFVRDWFGVSFVTNGMRQEYRYILSGSSSIDNFRSSATQFMGEYFKAGLRGAANACSAANACTAANACSGANSSWSSLMRSIGSCCADCIPVVDIDIEIQKDNLYHALGFACLIAQKSGAWRVLLLSGEPIWVDLTAACGDFCAMTALLWEQCEMRTRSRMSLGLELICRVPIGVSFSSSLRLVFFSETFEFDWYSWVPRLVRICPIVFWNIGSRASIPVDFYLDDHKGLMLMSGYMPRLVSSITGVSSNLSEGSPSS